MMFVGSDVVLPRRRVGSQRASVEYLLNIIVFVQIPVEGILPASR